MLLKNSFGNNYLDSQMQNHINFRIGVKFSNPMQNESETMFTRQVQSI